MSLTSVGEIPVKIFGHICLLTAVTPYPSLREIQLIDVAVAAVKNKLRQTVTGTWLETESTQYLIQSINS
jgi:hypothetical protein